MASTRIAQVLEILGFSIGLFHFILGGLFELFLPLWLLVYGFAVPAAKPKKAGASL